jgi:hypothetical protein
LGGSSGFHPCLADGFGAGLAAQKVHIACLPENSSNLTTATLRAHYIGNLIDERLSPFLVLLCFLKCSR